MPALLRPIILLWAFDQMIDEPQSLLYLELEEVRGLFVSYSMDDETQVGLVVAVTVDHEFVA